MSKKEKKVKEADQERAKDQARVQLSSIMEMVAELEAAEKARNEKEGRETENAFEKAEQRIREDALSVGVRSDWHEPGATPNLSGEYTILLCTGGPAVRIIGTLSQYSEPDSARIEYQDWFTPWVEFRITQEQEDAVLRYARYFYFGE